jgi:hypothetical protein
MSQLTKDKYGNTYELNNFSKLSKIWVGDLGSGKTIPNPGVERHRILDPDPQHWFRVYNPKNPVPPGRSNRYVGNAFFLVCFSMQQLKKEK